MTFSPPANVLFFALFLAGLARAQEEEVPQFRAEVDTVLVDALVLDSNGNPVSGLVREDFTILEDGVEQTITSFDVTDWTSYVAAQTGEASANLGEPRVNAYPRRFVFILNRQGAPFEYIVRAKRAMNAFVVEALADGDEAMVIDIGYSTKVLQEFVDDKQKTLASVKSLGRMEVPYNMGVDRAAQGIYQDLEALGGALAEYPGRKIIVLFSLELMTFPPPGSTYSSQSVFLKRAVDALNQSNTTVYTIDLTGVDRRGLSPYGGLSPLATETGGRYFRNSINYGPELERIGRENQRYYLLGYVSNDPVADGSYRKIEVRVDRPDVEVIARPGYFAPDREPDREVETTDASERTRAGRARADVSPADELPLAVEITTYLLPTGTNLVRVPLSVAIPEELLTGKGGSERKLTVTLAGEEGAVLHRFEQAVDLEHYYLLDHADLAPGAYMLSVSLASEEQELYRASTGLRVPAGFGERFGLSSVIPVVSPKSANGFGDGLPVLPTPSVKRGDDAFILFQVFAGQDEPARAARVGFTLYGENDEEILVGGREEPLELSDSPAGTTVILSIPTRTLDFGRYRVEVRVEDADDGRRATSDIELRVR